MHRLPRGSKKLTGAVGRLGEHGGEVATVMVVAAASSTRRGLLEQQDRQLAVKEAQGGCSDGGNEGNREMAYQIGAGEERGPNGRQ